MYLISNNLLALLFACLALCLSCSDKKIVANSRMFRRICHRFLCGSRIYYNTPDSLGYTKLHRAASNGQYEKVRRLVERGADVNIKTKNYGVTAVMEAAMREHGDIVKYLHQ